MKYFKIFIFVKTRHMKKIFVIILLTIAVSYYNSQSITSDTIISNSKQKIENYNNAVNWASLRNKEVDKKEIISKDSDIGFVNTEIVVKLFEDSSVNYFYSLNFKIDAKDNKYKISLLNPVVRIRMAAVDFETLGTSTLRRYRSRLKSLEEIMVKYFESKMEWDANELYKESNVQDTTSEQKEILNKIIVGIETFNTSIKSDCIKYLETNNDW